MYRVLTEQRAARGRRRAAPRPGRGFAIDVPAVRAAGREAASSGSAARTTRPASPDPRGDRRAPGRARGRCRGRRHGGADRRPRRGLRRVRRHEPGRAAGAVPAPDRRPDRQQGLWARRACGSDLRSPPATSSPAMEPYRPPGSVSTVSVAIVTTAPRVRRLARAAGRRASTPSATGWPPPSATAGLAPSPVRRELPARPVRIAGRAPKPPPMRSCAVDSCRGRSGRPSPGRPSPHHGPLTRAGRPADRSTREHSTRGGRPSDDDPER